MKTLQLVYRFIIAAAISLTLINAAEAGYQPGPEEVTAAEERAIKTGRVDPEGVFLDVNQSNYTVHFFINDGGAMGWRLDESEFLGGEDSRVVSWWFSPKKVFRSERLESGALSAVTAPEEELDLDDAYVIEKSELTWRILTGANR